MKKVIFRIGLVAVLILAGWGIYRGLQSLPGRQQVTPTTHVRRGDVIVRSYTRGELRAVRSVTLTAPNLFGTVQVTRLAPLGALAREKDLVVEFDESEVAARLEQRELELEQVDEQIKKAEADLAIRNKEDDVELLQARFAVRRAELEVQRNELLAEIDRKKNVLNLEEARRRLKQLESDIKSRREQAQAQIAVLKERRNRNVLDIDREKARILQTKLLAPMSGLVAIRQNRSGFSGMFGTAVPDIREGDQVPPGSPVADVLDLSELEVVARVGELDRANLVEGQDVLIRLDAVSNHTFSGKIKTMSGTASANIFSSDPGKKFDVLFSIDMKQLLSALGAKPDQIARVLSTAEANRRRPVTGVSSSALPTHADGMPGQTNAPAPPAGAAGQSGQSTRGGNGSNTKAGGTANSGGTQQQSAEITPPPQTAQGAATAGPANLSIVPTLVKFSPRDLQNAHLPPAPEEDSTLDVLLRPGLLADVEIIVDKVPNAVFIPNQSVFERDGKPVVYVKTNRGFEARSIKIAKRSESVSVISDGLNQGDVIAMSDPTVKPGESKKSGGKSGGAMGALPGGK